LFKKTQKANDELKFLEENLHRVIGDSEANKKPKKKRIRNKAVKMQAAKEREEKKAIDLERKANAKANPQEASGNALHEANPSQDQERDASPRKKKRVRVEHLERRNSKSEREGQDHAEEIGAQTPQKKQKKRRSAQDDEDALLDDILG
jgi:hypothetical protein